MPTRQQLERGIREQARRNNWGVVLDRWPHRTTYYTPDGRAMPNLPADPWSMQRYLTRGFSLAPPTNPTPPPAPSVGVDEMEGVVTPPQAQAEAAPVVATATSATTEVIVEPAEPAERIVHVAGVGAVAISGNSDLGSVFCDTCGKNFDKKKRPDWAKKAHKRAAGH